MQEMKEKCNKKTEVYSRVVGFYRPVDQWNSGKQEEFQDRRTYIVNNAN
jgi:ribonucleoside-triphosphate reductase